jgi:hypothetical protein
MGALARRHRSFINTLVYWIRSKTPGEALMYTFGPPNAFDLIMHRASRVVLGL